MIDCWREWLALKAKLLELRKVYAVKEDQKRLADFKVSALARRRHELREAGAAEGNEELTRVTSDLDIHRELARKARCERDEARYQMLTTLDKALE